MATRGIVATTSDNHGKLTMMKRLVNSGNGSSCTCRQSIANYCTQVCNLKTSVLGERVRANEEQNVSYAGRTLEDFKLDFKADLHPRTLGGCGLIRGLSQAIFCPKILYCVVSLRLFICLQSSSVRSRVLVESSSVRVQRIIRLKIGWTVFMSVVSHGFKIG